MGYVRSDNVLTKEDVMYGEYELEVATLRVKAAVTLAPLYDPKMAKIKV